MTSTILAFEDSINPKLTIIPTKSEEAKITENINKDQFNLTNNAWTL